MKINPKSEKGAITLIVLVTMLFLISFLISMYIRTANKAQISAETTEQIKQKYNNIGDEEQIYNSYFIADNVIPIYNETDFMNIDNEEIEEFTINGKIYKKGETSAYILMKDLEIDANGKSDFTANTVYNKIHYVTKFEGNGHTITVNNLNTNTYVFSGDNLWLALDSVLAGEYANETSIYKDGNEDIAIIPKGFTVSNVATEQKIEDGVVITTEVDENGSSIGNEFVWIPIDNVNDMFMCQGKTTDTICNLILGQDGKPYCTVHNGTNSELSKKMAGRLYATGQGETFNTNLKTQTYNANSGLREPAIVTGNAGKSYDGERTVEDEVTTYTNLVTIKTILGITDKTDYDSPSNFLGSLQEEYNNIVTSVIKYGGFYVGRYETSGMANDTNPVTIKIKKGEIPKVNIKWYNMYAQQKKFVGELGHLGGMIQGAAHDQVMKFVNVNNFATIAERVGTSGRIYGSGTKTEDMSKNIYDLRGNVREWTTEVYNTSYRVNRGSLFYGSNSASYRSQRRSEF